MTTKPWPQWQRAFAKAVDGCWTPQQLAWLNVVPASTVDNAAPSAALCDHGRRTHLAPMLTEVLRPAAVITRYTAAAKTVEAIPGPWQEGGLFPINDRFVSNSRTDEIRWSLRERGLCDTASKPARAPRSSPPQPRIRPPRPAAAAGAGSGLTALRDGLLAALTTASGYPAATKPSYITVGDTPIWAYIERRADAILVKFRVAPPYRTAEAISARLVGAGVVAHIGEVRAAPGSTRLWVRLRGPGDLAALQPELPALWQDYGRLR